MLVDLAEMVSTIFLYGDDFNQGKEIWMHTCLLAIELNSF